MGARVDWVEEGSFPVRASGGYGDMVTGLLIYGGILTALLGREKTGRGTLVTNSLFGTSMWVNAQSIVCAQAPALHKMPEDIDRPGSPVVHDYRCKDGERLALVGIGYDKNFPRYAKVLGIEDVLEEITFANGTKNAIPRPPLHLSGYAQRHTVPLGGVGQHTTAILLQLGYTQEEIQRMRQEGQIK